MGDPLPCAGVTRMLPVRSESELPLIIFADERGAIHSATIATSHTETNPLRGRL